MQNTTKEIITALGSKIVIKAFLTFDDLEAALDIENAAEKSKKIIETALVSVNGATEDAYKALRALPISEYLAVSKEVAAALNGGFNPAK